MANCLNYNCDELGEHETSIGNCSAKVVNGGAAVYGLLECNHTITDPSNAVQVQAAIDNGTLKMISGVKFGFGTPSPVKSPTTTACGSESTTSYDRTAVAEDYVVTDGNIDFYNDLKKRFYGGLLVFPCPTTGLSSKVLWVDSEISAESYLNFPNNKKEAQFFTTTYSWNDYDDPSSVSAPTGLVY